MGNVRRIEHEGHLLAIVADTNPIKDGISFFSPEDFCMQVGLHNRPKDYDIAAHEHAPFENISIATQEVFYILKGKVRVGLFYKGEKVEDVIMKEGYTIILNTGHDLTFLEDTRMFEVKQGPYRGKDKEKIML